MRIYLPSTLELLRAAVADLTVRPRSGLGFGVTDALRAEYPTAVEDELEYLALMDAARASLRLLAADLDLGLAAGGAPEMRVVIAADVDMVTPYPAGDRAALKLAGPVPWSDVAAVHLDGADAADAVRAAALAVDAADLGDLDADFTVGEAESRELAWYAPSEVVYLVAELS